MTIKRTIFISIIIVFSLFFIGFAALSCLFLFVPGYVESEVIPSIVKDTGIEISSLKVRSVGLSGAEISDIKIGTANNEGLAIDSIRLDYSIPGLFGRRLKKVVLSGISVNLEYKDNQISIKGLQGLKSNKEPGIKTDDDQSKPFVVNNLSIVNSVFFLSVKDKGLRVPFDLTATMFDQYQLPEHFRLEIFPGDNRVTVDGNIDNNKDIIFKFTSHAFSLNIFEDVINEITPLDIKGQADIELSTIFSRETISLTDISATCRLEQTIIACAGITIKNPVNSDKVEQPIIIRVKSKELNHWEYNSSSILLDTKTVPVMLEMSGTTDLSEDYQTEKLKAITRIISGDDPIEIEWNITANRENRSDEYKIDISGSPDMKGEKEHPIKANFDDMLFTVFSPDLNIQAEYKKGSLSGSYFLNVKEIVYKRFGIMMNIPDYRIKGAMQYNPEKGIKSDALVSFKNGKLSMSGNLLNATNISADIPFNWPLTESSQKGRLSINRITYENYSLGPVNIDILQKGTSIPFSGTITCPALPDMVVSISGNTTIEPMLDEGKMSIDIPLYNPASRIDLSIFSPALKGFYYRGNLSSIADIIFSDSGFQSELNLKIDSSTIENSEKDLSFENISLDLKLEDLLSMKSAFGQRLKVSRVSVGDIQVEDFILDFKVDGPSLLFIEKGTFKWCGGRINIQSFRVNPEKEEYDLTLFCDRLKLSEMLAQFGVANASGGGTVNGKLPVKISKNKIRFDDGFLYSTPGGGGKITITETDMLTKGLDPNSPEYAQMDIAREALKAFDYTWVKMSFESEKDELLLKLQFDGKPENRLPFRYSENAGRFTRVENPAEGSDFEGIGLDVNFRVPFDRILNIKDVLDMME